MTNNPSRVRGREESDNLKFSRRECLGRSSARTAQRTQKTRCLHGKGQESQEDRRGLGIVSCILSDLSGACGGAQ